jgi:hypothetical protein
MNSLIRRKKYSHLFVTLSLCVLFCSHCSRSNCPIPQDTVPSLYAIHGEGIDETFLEGRYQIQGSIPVFVDPDNFKPVSSINEIVQAFLTNEKIKWEQSVSENLPTDDMPRKAIFWIDFKPHYLSRERGSIQLFFSIDLGGAHPHEYTKALNIDFHKKTRMRTKDLFLSQSTYLKTVSSLVRSKLPQKLQEKENTVDREWIQQGTEPILDNYQNICITPQGLLVAFDPYQVASYGDGIQTIALPFSELKNILVFKPNPSADPSYSSTSQMRVPSVSRTIVPSL